MPGRVGNEPQRHEPQRHEPQRHDRADMKNSKTVLIDKNPGRNCQTFGVARELGTSVDLIHEPSVKPRKRRLERASPRRLLVQAPPVFLDHLLRRLGDKSRIVELA